VVFQQRKRLQIPATPTSLPSISVNVNSLCAFAFTATGEIARVSTEIPSPACSVERIDATRNITKPSVVNDTVLTLDLRDGVLCRA
jgi:hypothetical protein